MMQDQTKSSASWWVWGMALMEFLMKFSNSWNQLNIRTRNSKNSLDLEVETDLSKQLLTIQTLSKDTKIKFKIYAVRWIPSGRNSKATISKLRICKDKGTKHTAYSNQWSVRVKTWWKRSDNSKTPDPTRLPYNSSDSNCRNRREKAWVCSNTQRKSTLNMKKSWMIRKDENSKSSNNIKDLTTKGLNSNNRWGT